MKRACNSQRGSILVVVMFMVILVASFCLSSVMLTTADSRHADFMVHRTQALYVAQAGLEDLVRELSNMRSPSPISSPFTWYDSLAGQTMHDGSWITKDGVSMGQYDVQVTAVNTVDAWTRDVVVAATGHVPSKDHPHAVTRRIDAVVRVSVGRSEVFDYVYFINNWGWYYGNTIYAYGNVRANGQFDGGGYGARVNAIPRFKKLDGTDFKGYIDDGGLYAGWNIVGSQNMTGDANTLWTQADADAGKCSQDDVGDKKSLHPYEKQIPMPNLSDLTVYENLAKSKASTVKIGGVTVVSAVQGDDPGEPQHLYLRGTSDNPIVIDGPIVVRGSVIISGVVKGQGAIYSGGNVYIPKNLTYKNPPTDVPENPVEADMESWVATNQDADALGLFARENVVAGDYTSSTWQYYVKAWSQDSRNKSEEDAGEDGMPNTRAGRDGVYGTADDDVIEDDNTWTVEHYTAAHAAQGLIPPGLNVGDAIPGTGEDIDGDGHYDPGIAMSEFNIPASLTSTNWAGNVPAGTPSYSTISTTSDLTEINAAIYTNHHVAMLTLAYGQYFNFKGCVVSRNESIVYGTSRLYLKYDYRLLGEGESHGFYLPKAWNDVEVVYWTAQ